MKREKLLSMQMPAYSPAEDRMNALSHFPGILFGAAALILCFLYTKGRAPVFHPAAVYCISIMAVFSVSSIYHGMKPGLGKRMMRVADHSTIFFLIAGTYTPILLCRILNVDRTAAYAVLILEWGMAAVGILLNLIDMVRFGKISMCCYLGMGWAIVLAARAAFAAIDRIGLLLLLLGGVSYTVGAILYAIGKKHRYVHFVFHLFVLLGCILQFFCVYLFVL